jgi:hypothetical protein
MSETTFVNNNPTKTIRFSELDKKILVIGIAIIAGLTAIGILIYFWIKSLEEFDNNNLKVGTSSSSIIGYLIPLNCSTNNTVLFSYNSAENYEVIPIANQWLNDESQAISKVKIDFTLVFQPLVPFVPIITPQRYFRQITEWRILKNGEVIVICNTGPFCNFTADDSDNRLISQTVVGTLELDIPVQFQIDSINSVYTVLLYTQSTFQTNGESPILVGTYSTCFR